MMRHRLVQRQALQLQQASLRALIFDACFDDREQIDDAGFDDRDRFESVMVMKPENPAQSNRDTFENRRATRSPARWSGRSGATPAPAHRCREILIMMTGTEPKRIARRPRKTEGLDKPNAVG